LYISTSTNNDELAEKLHASDLAEHGYVMECTRLWATRPQISAGFSHVRNQLLLGTTRLTKREAAIIVCTTASALSDSYCSLAWGGALAQLVGDEAAAAVLDARVDQTLTSREAAIAKWVRKVVADANSTTIEDVNALRDAGLSEQEIFDATALCAFRIAFSTVNGALGAQPDWQLVEAAPTKVRSAVTYGRAPQTKQTTADE
jgi:uncharacterized peroxidase-related enzyme